MTTPFSLNMLYTLKVQCNDWVPCRKFFDHISSELPKSTLTYFSVLWILRGIFKTSNKPWLPSSNLYSLSCSLLCQDTKSWIICLACPGLSFGQWSPAAITETIMAFHSSAYNNFSFTVVSAILHHNFASCNGLWVTDCLERYTSWVLWVPRNKIAVPEHIQRILQKNYWCYCYSFLWPLHPEAKPLIIPVRSTSLVLTWRCQLSQCSGSYDINLSLGTCTWNRRTKELSGWQVPVPKWTAVVRTLSPQARCGSTIWTCKNACIQLDLCPLRCQNGCWTEKRLKRGAQLGCYQLILHWQPPISQ